MSGLDRVREYVESVVDWTCLEKIPLEKIVYFFAILDFWWSLMVFFISSMAHFLYVNPGGRSSFLQYTWVNHVDIYKYRRYQPWELEPTIDWTDNLRYINETREMLDKLCSEYRSPEAIPGDPGDYLKEVVGRPYSSGYNDKLRSIINLWIGTVSIIYLSTPSLLLAIWWRMRRARIIFVYIFIQTITVCLMFFIGGFLGEQLMCATDVAYGRTPMKTYFHIMTFVFAIYQAIKFCFLLMYILERELLHRRKDRGFPTKKIVRRTVRVAPLLQREEDEDADDEDEEAQQMERKRSQKSFIRLTRMSGGPLHGEQ